MTEVQNAAEVLTEEETQVREDIFMTSYKLVLEKGRLGSVISHWLHAAGAGQGLKISVLFK